MYIGAREQAWERRVLSQRDTRALARVVEPKAHIVEIGNGKKLQIDLRGEVSKERVTASELSYNTCGK